jgi:YggT family protein
MTTTNERHEVEVVREERIVRDNPPVVESETIDSPDRRVRSEVVRDDHGEVRQRVVENVGLERQANLRRVGLFIWLVTIALEAMIGLRFLLKLIAANPSNPFAQLVYGFTDLFLWPFQGLTITPAGPNGMVLEISSLIAMLVYAAAAWVFINLLYLIFTSSRSRSVSVFRREEL